MATKLDKEIIIKRIHDLIESGSKNKEKGHFPPAMGEMQGYTTTTITENNFSGSIGDPMGGDSDSEYDSDDESYPPLMERPQLVGKIMCMMGDDDDSDCEYDLDGEYNSDEEDGPPPLVERRQLFAMERTTGGMTTKPVPSRTMLPHIDYLNNSIQVSVFFAGAEYSN